MLLVHKHKRHISLNFIVALFPGAATENISYDLKQYFLYFKRRNVQYTTLTLNNLMNTSTGNLMCTDKPKHFDIFHPFIRDHFIAQYTQINYQTHFIFYKMFSNLVFIRSKYMSY